MTAEPAGGLILTNAAGVPGSVRILGDQVAAVGHDVRPAPGDSVADLAGYVLLPGLAEPHVHLDKVFTASRAEPVTPDLAGAIAAWFDLRGSLTEADFTDRARRAAAGYLASGTTAIRAHIEYHPWSAPFPSQPCGPSETSWRGRSTSRSSPGPTARSPGGRPGKRAALRDAIDAGANTVGGAPWLDPDPAAACDLLFGIAAAAGLPIDLHVDETTDPAADTLRMLIDLTRQGFGQRVTASHVVSLASAARRPAAHRRGPGRDRDRRGHPAADQPVAPGPRRPPGAGRGLTAVAALRDAGVPVAAGADNIRDPFNPLGRTDPLETASLLAAAAHLTPAQALAAVTPTRGRVLGRPPPPSERARRPGSSP